MPQIRWSQFFVRSPIKPLEAGCRNSTRIHRWIARNFFSILIIIRLCRALFAPFWIINFLLRNDCTTGRRRIGLRNATQEREHEPWANIPTSKARCKQLQNALHSPWWGNTCSRCLKELCFFPTKIFQHSAVHFVRSLFESGVYKIENWRAYINGVYTRDRTFVLQRPGVIKRECLSTE